MVGAVNDSRHSYLVARYTQMGNRDVFLKDQLKYGPSTVIAAELLSCAVIDVSSARLPLTPGSGSPERKCGYANP